MHNVTAVKIETADEPSDSTDEGVSMEEGDVVEQYPTKRNMKSEQVCDGAPNSTAGPPLQPKPDVPEERF